MYLNILCAKVPKFKPYLKVSRMGKKKFPKYTKLLIKAKILALWHKVFL